MTDWIFLKRFTDPPPAPEGYKTEVKRDSFFGVVIAYRYIKND